MGYIFGLVHLVLSCFLHSIFAKTCWVKTPYEDSCNNTGILLNCSNTGFPDVFISQNYTQNRTKALIPNNTGYRIVALDLSFNRITQISSATFFNFTDRQHITSIFLNNNNVVYIQYQAFISFPHLCYLDISYAGLKKMSVDENAFKSLQCLEILNIQNNNFQKTGGYPDTALSTLTSLRNLTIDIFDGFFFTEKFQKLTHLNEIHFNPIGGVTFRHSSFSGLSKSKITTISLLLTNRIYADCNIPKDLFCPFKRMTALYLKTRCHFKSALLSLKCFENRTMNALSITFNKPIAEFEPTVLDNSVTKYVINICVKKLDVSNNGISYIAFNFKNTLLWRCIEVLDISHNSIHRLTIPMAIAFYTMPNLREIYASNQQACFSPLPRIFSSGMFIGQSKQKKIDPTIYLPPKLEILDVHNNYMHIIRFNISFSGQRIKRLWLQNMGITLYMVQRAWFPSLLFLNISNNYPISVDLFQDMPQLETLVARSLTMKDANEFLFRNLPRLSYLDLSGNYLKNFKFKTFKNQNKSLISLILDHNDFSSIPAELKHLHNLENLSYKYNKFYSLSNSDITILEKMNNLKSVYLQGNPISCACSVRASLLWMKMHKHLLTDIKTIKCVDSGDLINELLKESSWRIFILKCISKDWIIVSATLLSIALITMISTILVRKYRVHLDYLIIKLRNRLKGIKSQESNTEFSFDVFISYCDTDEQWVCSTLHDSLSQRGLNVSLHIKNFLPGEPIAEQVVKFIDDSRKVLFVVTRQFLESGWSSYEIQMAVTHAFHSHRQAMIVVLIKDEIFLNNMPEELKNIWWTIRYIRWSDVVNENEENKFWNELESMLKEDA